MSDTNVMKMQVNDAVELLTTLYGGAAIKSGDIANLPSIMLWGPPGIGKSQAIRAIKGKLEAKTGKTVNVTDVRLLLFNPVDLRGIPTADNEKKLAVWLKPKIFQMDESSNVINILFLDEISAAPLSVQAAAYQITLDRVVGEHRLPANCIVIAAGNRVTDKSVAYKMPKALANRLTHIEIGCSIEDWKKWAIPFGIDQRIIAYLNFKQSALYQFDPSNDDNAFPTPRSWEVVDTYLKRIEKLEYAMPLIAGAVGLGAATEFKAYTQVFNRIPDVKAIYDGREKNCPTEPDVLYALSAAIVAYSTKATKQQLVNLLQYSTGMKAEFAALTIRDIVVMDDMRNKVLALPEWVPWSKRYKTFIM